MPGLSFAHFFRAAMVIANIGHGVDDLLAVELQYDPETPCVPGCCGPRLRNMKSVSSPRTPSFPTVRDET